MQGKGIILGAYLFLMLLTFGLYYSSLDNSFHYDDGHTVVNNPWIRDLKNIPEFFLSNTLVSESPQAANYRPLLMVTYALNYALGGLDPWGFHLVNVLIHALTVLVCFGLIRLLLGDIRPAILGALIIAIHPINSEAVNYITARSSLLSTLFASIAVLSFHLFRSPQREGLMVRSWGLYGLSLLCFLLALLSKETALMVPGLILLTDLVFHSDRIKGSYKQTLFLYLPWIGFTLGFLWIKGKIVGGNAIVILAESVPVESSSSTNILLSILTGLKLVGQYILTALWPVNLSMDHHLTRVASLWEGTLFLPILMICVLWVGIIWFWKREKVISFSILWFFVALLPVFYLPFFANVALFQENRGYAAMISLGILAGVAFKYQLKGTNQLYKTVGTLVIVLLLVFYTVIVMQRNAVWQDQFTLWSDAVKKSPLSPEPHISLAMLYRAKGDLESAFQEVQEALHLAPEHGLALHLLGDFYSRQGDLEKAVESYERSLRYAPGSWKTYTNLGTILSQQGQLEKAIERYRQALRLNPGDWMAHQNLIVAYAKQGQVVPILKEYEESANSKPDAFYYHYGRAVGYEILNRVEDATAAYQKSTELYPGFVEGFIRLCQLYIRTGDYMAANQQCEMVLKIDSQNWAAHYTLGLIAEQKDDLSLALNHYRDALKINPRDIGTHFNLGNVYRRTGQMDQAIEAYRASVELNPDFLRARFNLAKLLEQNGRQAEAVEQYQQITLRGKEGRDDAIKAMALENLKGFNESK